MAQMTGRASLSGEPSLYLGTVPLPTARKLIDALVYAESAKRRQPWEHVTGHRRRHCRAPTHHPRG
ncbi:hypothetical protein [Streptomyces caatingaensis]|uniref:Uncharacterized protein n=1 Tax=Streptomyces caatingaensis TaxID=1678637 RepID=A0A0K9XMM4_9ACTN|nr:hypothetical protein [Streptomyces caatingaensis]KNB54346.1 hypothetical protein AC230_00190 [Streptomyces caatingaensis]